MWKKVLKDYFSFTRKERIAVLSLLLVFALVLFLPSLFNKPSEQTNKPDEQLLTAIRQLTNNVGGHSADSILIASPRLIQKKNQTELFHFDPNTISEMEWLQLGVGQKATSSILKYISKGGRFKEPEDLLKMYSLPKKTAEKLIPYVIIKNTVNSHPKERTYVKNPSLKTGVPAQKQKNYFEIEINSTDTSELKLLPGIGGRRAAAIVEYRNLLGGFISIDQISEVFNLPDSVFRKLKPFFKLDTSLVDKININTATLSQLSKHPYIGSQTGRVIVEYRSQHGFFKDQDELQKLHYFDENLYRRLSSYLTVK